jgi:hypothetical protein
VGTFEKLQDLYKRIRLANREPREHAGLEEIKIEEAFRGIGLEPSLILRQLYQWHNGISNLLGFLYFEPLQDSLRNYYNLEGWRSREPTRLRSTWFPVLNFNGDVLFCLDIETDALVAIDAEADRIEVLAEHFESYVDAIAVALESGAVKLSEGGEFELNDALWQQIAKAHRVQSAWL